MEPYLSRQAKIFVYSKIQVFLEKSGFSENFMPENFVHKIFVKLCFFVSSRQKMLLSVLKFFQIS